MWRDDDGGGCTDDVELMDLGDPGGSSVVDESDSEDDGVDSGVGTTYSSTSRRTVPFSLVAPLYAVAFLQAAAILMALSLLFPVTSKKLCSVNATWNSTTNECTDAITEAVSTDVGTYNLLMNLSNFVSVSAIGELSDVLGRKRALLMSLSGVLFTFMLYALVGGDPTMTPFVLALTAVFGLAAGQAGINVHLFSMIADATKTTPVVERTTVFGKLLLAMYCGYVAGPLLGGILVSSDALSEVKCYFVVSGFQGAAMVITVLALPETRPVRERTTFRLSGLNPIAGILLLATDKVTLQVLLVQFCTLMAFCGIMMIVPADLVSHGQSDYTSYFSASLFASCTVAQFVLPKLLEWTTVKRTLQIGLFLTFGALCLLSIPFLTPMEESRIGVSACLITSIWTVGAVWDAPCRTLAVARHPPEKIGMATAGLNTLQIFVQGVGNKLGLVVQNAGLHRSHPYAGYLFVAVLSFLGFLLTLCIPDVDGRKKGR